MGNCFGLSSSSSSPDEPKHSAITPSFSSGLSEPSTAATTITRGFSESSSSAGNSRFSLAASEFIDERDPNGEILEAPNLRVFTYSELKSATKGFKIETVLGEGGFGKVYKGWIDDKLKTGSKTVVAIKKLNSQSLQGFEQWQSEINFLGSLSHPNLVRLVGYCWEDKELLLVYEYMAKGSLENHLFRKSVEPLAWDRRISIALGAARGLAFLHNLDNQIIYRDFKASNILLDGKYSPKLSDFGLAKFGPSGDNSHVTTRVMGTFGYAAPEYVATGHLYVKSDVYGFGVVLLELLTGLRAIDTNRANGQKSLVDWARPSLSSKKKAQRRLSQNREAARKSRIRKKAYVQQLELSRLKLVQLEQQLQAERARQQVHPTRMQMMQVDTGIRAFEKEYGEWMEQQKKLICETRVALQSHDDGSVRIVAERWMKQYSDLFRMKSNAAKSDVFYLMSGMWKSPAERLFFWLGGFRPSDLLKVVIPVIEDLSEKQRMDVCNLEHSCQQAEDALSQGMERLHHTLAGAVAVVAEEGEGSNSGAWMSIAVERLDALVSFVNQADHLRQETLQQMRRILTILPPPHSTELPPG